MARLWNEALLAAIRRDFPAPTVHARNLYHVSAAMWDAWAAYDPVADGVFVDEDIELADPTAARNRPSAMPPTGCCRTATGTPPAATRACASSIS